MTRAADLADISPGVPTGFRNAIINGDFKIWQRGTSFSVSPAVSLFTADRFSVFNNATSTPVTVSQQAFTPGNQISGYEPVNFLRCTVSGYSSSAVFIGQKIEDVQTFAGQTITVSYWAKASASMSLPLDYVQWFGTGGSSLVNASLATASVTTSWQRFTHTFTVPSISGKTVGVGSSFEVRFLMSANGSLDIWGVQVERGTIATPFEQRPIGTELALCQRYFEKSFNTYQTPVDGIYTNHYMTFIPYDDFWVHSVPLIPFRVEKRSVPTITFYGDAGKWQRYNSNGTYTTLAVTGTGFQSMSSISTTGFGAGCHNNGSSGLAVGTVRGFRGDWVASAEL